jgi:hypothetical protein
LLHRKFDASIFAKLGPSAKPADFLAIDLTPDPDFDLTDDDHTPLERGDALWDTPTPEVGDNYVSSEPMFPRNGELTKGRVVSHKHDAIGNPIRRAHQNPVLDTRLYLMEFKDSNITELTANTFAESMYSQSPA